MKHILLVWLLLSSALSIGVIANHDLSLGYERSGYGSSPSYEGRSTLSVQQQYGSFGYTPYPQASLYNYQRYNDHWGPFDFKLSRTINHDVIENLIKSFDGEDLDLLYALAALNPNDHIDQKYILDGYLKHNDFDCLSLDAYNTLANVDRYDQYDAIDLNNLDENLLTRDFLRRFDLTDYNRIANANPNDRIKP